MIDAPLPVDDLDHACALVSESAWRELSGQCIFLTGGTGFIGKWLIATLLEADRRFGLDCRLIVLSRDPRAFAARAPHLSSAPRVELLEGDVRDFEFPAGRIDRIIHAATDVVQKNTPEATFATCVDGTRRVLDLAAHSGASHLLLTSSGAVYGRQPPDLDRLPESHAGAPDCLAPVSAYGEGKRVSEWQVCARSALSGLQVRIARVFALAGPYQPLDSHFAFGNFLGAALTDDAIVIKGDGTPFRSYLHAADMAGWLWAILLRGDNAVAYNVGGEEAVSIGQLARRIVDSTGSKSRIETLEPARSDCLAERYVPDTRRARERLGLGASISLDETILRTARWHRLQQLQRS
jgi:dTDP-glucose 4,6-dehydratase